MNRISIELLKLSGRLEDAGLSEHASELSILAEEIAKDDRLLTVAEAAVWLGCGRRTLDQLITDRRIPRPPHRRTLPLLQTGGLEGDKTLWVVYA